MASSLYSKVALSNAEQIYISNYADYFQVPCVCDVLEKKFLPISSYIQDQLFVNMISSEKKPLERLRRTVPQRILAESFN